MINLSAELLASTKKYRVVAMTPGGKKTISVLADDEAEAKEVATYRFGELTEFSIIEVAEVQNDGA